MDVKREGGTYWKMVAEPPALSTPAFTDSATVCGRINRISDEGIRREGVGYVTFRNVAVHGVDNDGNFRGRHLGSSRRRVICSSSGCGFVGGGGEVDLLPLGGETHEEGLERLLYVFG